MIDTRKGKDKRCFITLKYLLDYNLIMAKFDKEDIRINTHVYNRSALTCQTGIRTIELYTYTIRYY